MHQYFNHSGFKLQRKSKTYNPLPDGGNTDRVKAETGTDTVNAGADQTVYLSHTSTVLLPSSGSSGGT